MILGNAEQFPSARLAGAADTRQLRGRHCTFPDTFLTQPEIELTSRCREWAKHRGRCLCW